MRGWIIDKVISDDGGDGEKSQIPLLNERRVHLGNKGGAWSWYIVSVLRVCSCLNGASSECVPSQFVDLQTKVRAIAVRPELVCFSFSFELLQEVLYKVVQNSTI